MIAKDKFLIALKESLDTEEKGIPLYAKHIGNAMFLSGSKPEDRQKVADVLRYLTEDTLRHKKIFCDLIDRVKEDHRDVF